MHTFKVQGCVAIGFCADFSVMNNHTVEVIKGKASSVDRWLAKRKLWGFYNLRSCQKFGNIKYHWSDISPHISS